MKQFYIYLLLYNFFVFGVYGLDKWAAIKRKKRIKEKTLLLLSFCGASLGALLGMHLFRHKLNKLKFSIFVPVLFLVHVAILFIFLIKKH